MGSLYLDYNQLSGPIPAELGNLANLGDLVLSGNQLSGPIPAALGRLRQLSQLWMSNNRLSGPIPPELGRLPRLRDLLLDGNRLSGPIPPALGRLPQLEILGLGRNQLSGPIPPELGNLPQLRTLRLSHNQLSGPVPEALSDLPSLRTISLRDNPGLDGCLPRDLHGKLRDVHGQLAVGDLGSPGQTLRVCLLRDLQLSGATLDPPFAESTTAYTAAVPGPFEEIVVWATLHDATDTVTIRKGARTYANGAAVPLARRANLITIKATPADGGPTQRVTVTVTRSRTDPIALPLRAGGELFAVPAGVATTAADLFRDTNVTSVWLYNRTTRAWDRSYIPGRGRDDLPIVGWDLLWVVAPADLTLVVQGSPPASDPGPITLTLRQGGDLVVVPAGAATTAAALFGETDVSSVWKYNRATRLWDLSYLPTRDRGDFPIAPGDALWVVSPRAQTVSAGAPAGAAVSGHVYFAGGEVALPEGAVVTVQLLDTSLADAAATVIGEQIIGDARGLPLAFRVGYDPADIRESYEYSLQATVRHAGRLLYINDTVHLVLTRGAPRNSDIQVIRVG